jgi:hypothetical protein
MQGDTVRYPTSTNSSRRHRSVGEGVEDGADVDGKSGGDEPHEPRGGLGGGAVAGAAQRAELDLHDHHHAIRNTHPTTDPTRGGQHPEPEHAGVDVGTYRRAGPWN